MGQHGFEIEMHAWAKNVNKGTEDRMYSFGNVFCCCVLIFLIFKYMWHFFVLDLDFFALYKIF